MSTDYFDRQPIGRTVGRRTAPRAGAPPSAETRAPKGIYRYTNHDDMQRDRDRWQAAAMVETARVRG